MQCTIAVQNGGVKEKVSCEVEQDKQATGVQQSLGGQERILRESAATEMVQARESRDKYNRVRLRRVESSKL